MIPAGKILCKYIRSIHIKISLKKYSIMKKFIPYLVLCLILLTSVNLLAQVGGPPHPGFGAPPTGSNTVVGGAPAPIGNGVMFLIVLAGFYLTFKLRSVRAKLA